MRKTLHFSIFFFIFLANAFLEVKLLKANDLKSAAQRAGVKWDRRSRHEVRMGFRKEGIIAYPKPFSAAVAHKDEYFSKEFKLDFDDFFPLSGIANVKTILCNEAGEWVSYTSDRYGFNNDDRVYEKMKNAVILIGDSFVHGNCVPPGDDIAGNLRRRGYTAISLGTGGNGPLIELAILKEYGPYLSPKIILWMYYEGNDFQELLSEYNHYLLKKYLNDGYTRNLIKRQEEIDRFWIGFFHKIEKYIKGETQQRFFWKRDRVAEFKGSIWRTISLHHIRKLIGLTRKTNIPPRLDNLSSAEELKDMFRIVMKSALQEAKRQNSKLYFVYLPAYKSFSDQKYSFSPSAQSVCEIVSELGIPVIDFYEYLKNTGDPAAYYPFRKYGHYNARGYDLLGDLLEREVLEKAFPLGKD